MIIYFICIFILSHLYFYIYLYLSTYLSISISIAISISIYLYLDLDIYLYYFYIYFYIYIYIYNIHMYISTYIHVYVYTYIHIYTYIHVYIYKLSIGPEFWIKIQQGYCCGHWCGACHSNDVSNVGPQSPDPPKIGRFLDTGIPKTMGFNEKNMLK